MYTHKDSVFPFTPYQAWLTADWARWRAEVFVPPRTLVQYDSQQSLLVYGVRGSGLSTFARIVADIEAARNAFVVWWRPGSPALHDFFKTAVNRIEEEMVERLRAGSLDSMLPLRDMTLEAWCGLLTHYQFDGNAYRTLGWLQQNLNMTRDEATSLEKAHERLAPRTLADTVYDLIDIVEALGYAGIVGIVPDVNIHTLPALQEWINHRVLQARRGLRMVAMVRADLHLHLDDTSRWQMSRLEWDIPQIQAITHRAFAAAWGEPLPIPPYIFDVMHPLFERELGMTPYGATALAEALYWWRLSHKGWPTEMEPLLHWLYDRSIPLRYDEATGTLYRGLYRLPALGGVPANLLDRLYRQGRTGVDREDLEELLGTGSNAHMVARRIRGLIEPPFQKSLDPLYLKTRFGDGYILEHIEAW